MTSLNSAQPVIDKRRSSSRIIAQDQYIQNIKNYEDFELGVGIQQLMQKVTVSSAQFRYSLKYQDENLELEFQKKLHQEICYLSKIFAFEYFLITLIYFIFQTYKLITFGGNYPMFKWVIILVVVFNALLIVHYYLSKRFIKVALYFAEIQSIMVMVSSVEYAIVGNSNYESVDLFPTAVVLIASASYFSYNQFTLFLSYLICWGYNFGRTYFWISTQFRYLRFNIFFVASFCFIYFFSRAFQQRQREKFQKNIHQVQILKLFHNLIKVYHDGIIITQGEEIIFYNKEVNTIFDLPQEITNSEELSNGKTSDQQHLQDYAGIMQKKQKISEVMKCTYPQVDQEIISTMSHQLEEINLHETSLWQYVVAHYYKTYSFLQQIKDQKTLLDGVFFKFKNQGSNNKKVSKKLQAFTQQLKIGEDQLILTTIRDMSQWLEIERQKNLCSMKTIAFASAAHEFRNPLNGIVSSLDILDSLIKDESKRQYFCIAKNCAELMLFLVRDILDFSQIEARSFMLNFQVINLNQLVLECINVLKFKADTKQISLSIADDSQLLSSISTDSNRVKQILINLISNAIKYTMRGYVSIKVEQDLMSKVFRIIVEDSGVGMNQQQIDKLFISFTKFMKNRHLNEEGVGLGLMISQNLAQALGGNISVISEVGVGSKFTLQLPFQQGQFQRGQSYINESIKTESLFLSIQDDPEQGICPSILRRLGFNNHQSLFSRSIVQRQEQPNRQAINFAPSVTVLINEIQLSELENSNSSQQLETIQDLLQSRISCKCPKVLIVDDDPFNLISLEGSLEQLGLTQVDKAYNGQEALQKVVENSKKVCLSHQCYQLVILDQNMPILNGAETAIKIRKMQKYEQLPPGMKIVLFSGDEFISDKNLKAFDAVLSKPLDRKTLVAMLQKMKVI